VVTVLASGGANAADAEGWDATALARLDVPVLQAMCLTSSRAAWEASDAGARRSTRPCRSRSRSSTGG
jgi:cobaltochelatase CobN